MCQFMEMVTRNKKMVSYALDPELLGRLDAWLKTQEFPPSKTAVVEAALRQFLDDRAEREEEPGKQPHGKKLR